MLVSGDVASMAERSASCKKNGPNLRQISASSFAASLKTTSVTEKKLLQADNLGSLVGATVTLCPRIWSQRRN